MWGIGDGWSAPNSGEGRTRPRIHMDKHGYTYSTIQKRSLAIYSCDPCKSVAGILSNSGDSFYQVFLLTLALGPDGEGVEYAERERILQGFILPVA